MKNSSARLSKQHILGCSFVKIKRERSSDLIYPFVINQLAEPDSQYVVGIGKQRDK